MECGFSPAVLACDWARVIDNYSGELPVLVSSSTQQTKQEMTSNPTLTGSAYHINQRLSFAAILCTVRYIGPVEGTSGEWLGVEWDEPTKGKHSGEHGGKKYFDCG